MTTSPENYGAQFNELIRHNWTANNRDVAIIGNMVAAMKYNLQDLPVKEGDLLSDNDGPIRILPGTRPGFEHHWRGGSHITHYFHSSPGVKTNMGSSPVPRPGPLKEHEIRQVTDAWENTQDLSSKAYTQFGYIAPEDRENTRPPAGRTKPEDDGGILGPTDVWRHSPFNPPKE
jgi:hypothetical protein